MKKIDNRREPIMKYQYFDICQLAEYPEIGIKIVGEEVWVDFDGEHIDTFDVKKLINGIVKKNIKTIEEEQNAEEQF